jgi:Aspartyl protease
MLAGEQSLYAMSYFRILFLTVLIPTALQAETGCPAHIKAIPFHNGDRHEMIVEVSINHSGPYDFLFDTGTQMTVVDQSLAAELHLAATGKAVVAGVSLQGPAAFAQLDDVELGDHAATNQGVLIYDMRRLQLAGFAIRGLLGADFLSRFDVLINNGLKVVCVDDTGVMLHGVNSEQVARVGPAGATAKSRRPAGSRLNAASSGGDD